MNAHVHDYPNSPAIGQTDTSAEAALSMANSAGRLQRTALFALQEVGQRGLTSQELADRTGVDFGSIQPRTSELRRKGLIADSGQRRLNRNGKRAIVWVACQLAGGRNGYLHVDPFVSSHAANENDNMEIDAIAKEWAMVAKNTGAGIGLAHHVSKAGAAEATALSGRGAVALINACRSVLVLNRMNEVEAAKFGIEEQRRRRFFRVYDDKNNRAPPSDKSDWFQMLSISLPNGPMGTDGDNMGVVVPWSAPDAFEGVTLDHLRRLQATVAAGEFKYYHTAGDWVGNAVAGVFGLDPKDKGHKARILQMLDMWEANGIFKGEERRDKNRQLKKFMVVGRAVDDHSATSAASRSTAEIA